MTDSATVTIPEVVPTEPAPRRRLRPRSPGILVPLVIIGLYLIAAAIGPALIPYDPIATPLEDRLLPPGSPTATGGTAWLGTDALGRDLLGQIIHGARTSVIIGVSVVLISLGVGVLIGAVAGYRGGWVDAVLARCIDILQAFPGLVLAIVIAGIFTRSLLLVIIALSVTNWISFARVTRGVVLSLRERYWVDAARLMGVPGPRPADPARVAVHRGPPGGDGHPRVRPGRPRRGRPELPRHRTADLDRVLGPDGRVRTQLPGQCLVDLSLAGPRPVRAGDQRRRPR